MLGKGITASRLSRRKQAPALEDMLQLPQLRGVPAILISDVYGNRSVWIQEET